MCGEKLGSFFLLRCCTGSPPRVRGKALKLGQQARAVRITPARAGKRYGGFQVPGQKGDHPRACGEKNCGCVNYNFFLGSPPRVRGKDAENRSAHLESRITPARAGKSRFSSHSLWKYGDHPRACGEKRSLFQRGRDHQGSPPRVRGKAYSAAGHCTRRGITPARAGKRHNPDTEG